ncbi:hypothetical protein E2C01_068212 [Portunus trituberculatus]|uniref:Uncharacterized protein n=1 Tax=Portunus trituberculatus TaxID=210409 RepID=A0A5B7HLV1_PORTR|nr:hypothetical protein [Portunus trituberculatus]
MVYLGRGRKALRVMYINIDGFISGSLEVRDYILEKGLDVICITETKLSEDVQVNFKEQGYNVWRRDRRGKAIVLIMI